MAGITSNLSQIAPGTYPGTFIFENVGSGIVVTPNDPLETAQQTAKDIDDIMVALKKATSYFDETSGPLYDSSTLFQVLQRHVARFADETKVEFDSLRAPAGKIQPAIDINQSHKLTAQIRTLLSEIFNPGEGHNGIIIRELAPSEIIKVLRLISIRDHGGNNELLFSPENRSSRYHLAGGVIVILTDLVATAAAAIRKLPLQQYSQPAGRAKILKKDPTLFGRESEIRLALKAFTEESRLGNRPKSKAPKRKKLSWDERVSLYRKYINTISGFPAFNKFDKNKQMELMRMHFGDRKMAKKIFEIDIPNLVMEMKNQVVLPSKYLAKLLIEADPFMDETISNHFIELVYKARMILMKNGNFQILRQMDKTTRELKGPIWIRVVMAYIINTPPKEAEVIRKRVAFILINALIVKALQIKLHKDQNLLRLKDL